MFGKLFLIGTIVLLPCAARAADDQESAKVAVASMNVIAEILEKKELSRPDLNSLVDQGCVVAKATSGFADPDHEATAKSYPASSADATVNAFTEFESQQFERLGATPALIKQLRANLVGEGSNDIAPATEVKDKLSALYVYTCNNTLGLKDSEDKQPSAHEREVAVELGKGLLGTTIVAADFTAIIETDGLVAVYVRRSVGFGWRMVVKAAARVFTLSRS